MKFTLDGQYLGEQRTNILLSKISFTPDGHIVSYKRDIGQVYFLSNRFAITDSLIGEDDVDTIGRRKYVNYDAFDTFFKQILTNCFFTII